MEDEPDPIIPEQPSSDFEPLSTKPPEPPESDDTPEEPVHVEDRLEADPSEAAPDHQITNTTPYDPIVPPAAPEYGATEPE